MPLRRVLPSVVMAPQALLATVTMAVHRWPPVSGEWIGVQHRPQPRSSLAGSPGFAALLVSPGSWIGCGHLHVVPACEGVQAVGVTVQGERVMWTVLESYRVLGALEEASGPSGVWRSLPGGGDASPWLWGTPGSFLSHRETSCARPEAQGPECV